MKLIFGLMMFAAVAVFLLVLVAMRYRSQRKADEIYYLEAEDGWPLAVHYYRPRKSRKGLLPIITCHGLGANRFNLDLTDRMSIALALAEQGYEVFNIELRGVGKSKRDKWFYPGKWDISFDDFIHKDIPAFVNFVLKTTGASQAHWVGHSMGGMVAYATCQFETAKKLRSVTAIAGPGHLKPLRKTLAPVLKFRFLLKAFPVIHQAAFSMAYTPIGSMLRNDPTSKYIYNGENMSPEILRVAGTNLVEDLPTRLMLQFADWVLAGDQFSLDGYSYNANLQKVTTPMLLLSGERDVLASYDSVRYVFDSISSKDKKHVHFSKQRGTSDYGHGDIVLGEKAPIEVYPIIIQWIEDHKRA